MPHFHCQEELEAVLNKLTEQRDHYYHRLPQEVKNRYIHEIQEAFVEQALFDTLAEVSPEKFKAKAPSKRGKRQPKGKKKEEPGQAGEEAVA
ncbi:hypothetical protein HK097_004299, partial [Rhizophlyctis rosea]